MLDPDRATRLGIGGVAAIREHNWLASLDWEGLANQTVKAPFIPDSKKANFDAHQDDIMAALDVNPVRPPSTLAPAPRTPHPAPRTPHPSPLPTHMRTASPPQKDTRPPLDAEAERHFESFPWPPVEGAVASAAEPTVSVHGERLVVTDRASSCDEL